MCGGSVSSPPPQKLPDPPPPPPPAPEAPPQSPALNEGSTARRNEADQAKRKRRGVSALRIDLNMGGTGTGLNIPTG